MDQSERPIERESSETAEAKRKAYVPPAIEDLGSIEESTFQTSFTLG